MYQQHTRFIFSQVEFFLFFLMVGFFFVSFSVFVSFTHTFPNIQHMHKCSVIATTSKSNRSASKIRVSMCSSSIIIQMNGILMQHMQFYLFFSHFLSSWSSTYARMYNTNSNEHSHTCMYSQICTNTQSYLFLFTHTHTLILLHSFISFTLVLILSKNFSVCVAVFFFFRACFYMTLFISQLVLLKIF